MLVPTAARQARIQKLEENSPGWDYFVATPGRQTLAGDGAHEISVQAIANLFEASFSPA
jgi:hypothetical protein